MLYGFRRAMTPGLLALSAMSWTISTSRRVFVPRVVTKWNGRLRLASRSLLTRGLAVARPLLSLGARGAVLSDSNQRSTTEAWKASFHKRRKFVACTLAHRVAHRGPPETGGTSASTSALRDPPTTWTPTKTPDRAPTSQDGNPQGTDFRDKASPDDTASPLAHIENDTHSAIADKVMRPQSQGAVLEISSNIYEQAKAKLRPGFASAPAHAGRGGE